MSGSPSDLAPAPVVDAATWVADVTRPATDSHLSLALSTIFYGESGGWDEMPELLAASSLRRTGADDVEVRLFLTFTAAMD